MDGFSSKDDLRIQRIKDYGASISILGFVSCEVLSGWKSQGGSQDRTFGMFSIAGNDES